MTIGTSDANNFVQNFQIPLRLRGGNVLVQQKPALKTCSSYEQFHPDEQKPEIHRAQSVLLLNEVSRQQFYCVARVRNRYENRTAPPVEFEFKSHHMR